MTEIFNAFQPYANIKHINFTYESNFRYMNVWFDKEKMESILKNIISNALKYTPENGNVQIFVSENNDSWSVEVKDTGIGIPASEQKKLFKPSFPRQQCHQFESDGKWYRFDAGMETCPVTQGQNQPVERGESGIGD